MPVSRSHACTSNDGQALAASSFMPYDGCAGKSGDEIPDVVFEGALLLRSAGIAGGRAVGGDSSGVCDVAAGGVVAAGALVISQGSTVRSSLLGTSRSTLPSRWMRSV